MIAISLALIALSLVLRLDDGASSRAYAQPTLSGGARGVFAFTGQLTRDSYGLFMVDVDVGTVWCYRYMTSGDKVLKLVAVRDWRYDRYLPEYGTEPPIDVIKQQVEQYRAASHNNTPPTGP
ncbi:MAG TPA: hypothetical protein P5572_14935 [Phycisphaerae bacterium]|nr:hypothetical protein [Phycisphaerae bacterium]